MIWMTWRQHRFWLIAFAVVFAGLAGAFVLPGIGAEEVFFPGSNVGGAPAVLAQLEMINKVLSPLPLLVGMFAGAPLIAREFEQHTFRYAWTQGVSQRRWLATKLLFLGAVIVLLSAAFAAVHFWWYTPAATKEGYFPIFNLGIPLPAACLFDFALGVAAGAVLKSTVSAMAVTLIGHFGVLIVLVNWLRPNYLTPVRNEGSNPGRGLFLHQEIGPVARPGYAGSTMNGHEVTTIFQPGTRFVPFQLIEAGIYLGLAAVCCVVAWWWLRRQVIR